MDYQRLLIAAMNGALVAMLFAVPFAIVLYFIVKRGLMRFSFKVGLKEVHQIDFESERMLGRTKILIDGQDFIQRHKFVNGDRNFEFNIGREEVHNVKINLHMPFLYGAYRKWECSVIIDGVLWKTFESKVF